MRAMTVPVLGRAGPMRAWDLPMRAGSRRLPAPSSCSGQRLKA